ncbi:MAG TPA: LptA/OstA family protein [Anaeromyxobacter sp.]|nr:LptA/OstA family protein [Anaeromyxobacter sp.]
MTAALAIALSALAGAAAPADEAARAAPVRVDAEHVVYAFQKREVTFTGKDGKPVVMTRDDARLSCRKLVAHTDEAGQIVTAACSGDVRLTRGARVVTCERATFDGPSDRVVCEGNPVLKDGGSEARGTRLVYELRADQANLEGAVITLPGEEVEQRQKALEARRKEREP